MSCNHIDPAVSQCFRSNPHSSLVQHNPRTIPSAYIPLCQRDFFFRSGIRGCRNGRLHFLRFRFRFISGSIFVHSRWGRSPSRLRTSPPLIHVVHSPEQYGFRINPRLPSSYKSRCIRKRRVQWRNNGRFRQCIYHLPER